MSEIGDMELIICVVFLFLHRFYVFTILQYILLGNCQLIYLLFVVGFTTYK